MYRILYNDSTIFDPYGNDNEVVSDASMSVKINAAAYMDFTMPRLHPLYNTIAERDGVVTLYWDKDILFQGVIESIDMDINGNKAVSCVSALDYLNDTVVRPYSTIAGEQELTAPSSIDGYFQWLINQHNKHVLDSRKRFDVGVNQGANLKNSNFIYRSSTNNPTTASEISDQLLDTLGGYLIMRYADGRYVLDLYSSLNTVNSQVIDFGVNITDFSKTVDTKDQYTALILKGGSPEFDGGSFENGDWSHWITHPDEPLVKDKTHGGYVSSFFVSGTGEYINDSSFYFRHGRRYRATVYVKNERGSNVTIHGSYQYEQSGMWTTKDAGASLVIKNEGDNWTEFTFDFMPNISEYSKIRPRWYFDDVSNDSDRRVYLDDFSFSRVIGDTTVAEDPISISMVPDGVTQYDQNILKTGDVIYDSPSVLRYGYKEEVYEDSTITDVNDLIKAGIEALIKRKNPQISLDIKAVDLSLFMKEYTHLNVGDVVRVRSAAHNTDEYLMVNSITLDLQDPGQSEYSIGKAYDGLAGQQSGLIKSLKSTINSSFDSVVSLNQTAKDHAVQISSTKQAAESAQSTADSAQQMSTANSEAIEVVKSTQTEYGNQLNQVQQDVSGTNDKIEKINERIDNTNSEIESAKSDINSLRSSTETELQNVKTELETNYSTTDEIAEQYATKSEVANTYLTKSDASNTYLTKSDASNTYATKSMVEQTSQSITSSVEAAYATKATVESLENIANNAVQTWMSSGVPTLSNKPASDWTTSELKSQHSGDIYYDSDTGYSYRFGSSDGQNYSWALVKDTDITKAIADAAKAQKTADSATSGVSELKSSIPVTYATKTELTQKADLITSRVEEVAQAGTATSSKVTQLEQKTDEIKSTVSEQGSKLNNAVTTISQVSQKADSISSTVQQVQGNLDSLDFGGTNLVKLGRYEFNSSVTNTSYNRDQDLYTFTVPANLTSSWGYGIQSRWGKSYMYAGVPWGKCGILSFYIYADRACTINVDVNNYPMTADAGSGNDHDNMSKRANSSYSIPANQWVQVWSRWENSNSTESTGNPTKDDLYHSSSIGVISSSNAINVKIKQLKVEVGTKPTAWSPCPADVDANIETAQGTANSALSKVSTVEQNLDGFKTSVAQTYETKTDALNKQSTLNQKVDSLRTEVSETYATKTALNNASSTTNMWPNQWFDTSKPLIGGAPVGNEIEAAPVGGNIRIIENRDNFNPSVSSSVTPGRKYKVSVDAKKISGTKSVISGGIWYTSQTSGNAWDGASDFTSVKDYGNGWHRFERTITVPANKTRGTACLQLNENSGNNNPAKWKISNLRFEDVTDIADIQANYSTKSYVDQTSRTVSLGVVEEYKKGQHGSALATQSDITAAKDSITSTVSQTYTTKSDFNNLQISGGRNIARDTKNFGNTNVGSSDSGYLRYCINRTNGTYNGCVVRSLISSDSTNCAIFEYNVSNVSPGEYYTMSFWAKGSGTMRLYCYGPGRGYIGAFRIASSDGQAADSVFLYDGQTNMALSSDWKRYWVTWKLRDNPPSGYNTDKYFLLRNDNKMTSCDVCGVMIEKGNKVSEWAPAPEDIETTYASKSEVKQTVDGLNVTIGGLQRTANTASGNAANAQNRVGNLETCIKMTTDGVRVGKISNGNFRGYSALVNSNGSFDILDGSSSVVATVGESGINTPGGSFWINGRPAVRNAAFDFYREFTSLDVPWRLWIKHAGYGMVWLRIAGTTNGNSVDRNGAVITNSLPYSFNPASFIGEMHVAMTPVGVCGFSVRDKTLTLSAGRYAYGKVSYDGAMILMCDI